MLIGFVVWWTARMTELLPWLARVAGGGAPDGVVFDVDPNGAIAAWLRRNGRENAITMEQAARMARRRLAVLRPAATAVLEKRHVVPAAPRRDLDLLLRHEIGRITPFAADALFWRWDGLGGSGDRSRTAISLTMVPKVAVAASLERLAAAGIEPRFLEAGVPPRLRLLAIREAGAAGSTGRQMVRPLAWTCAGLAAIALLLPFAMQGLALYRVNRSIADLQPAVARVEALRRSIAAGSAGQAMLTRELQRTGDVLEVLATVTRLLPDDTFLTDFTFRDRRLAMSGRSAAAAHLITGLTADPAIRGAAFAAPVTRIEGSNTDVFSIQAEIVP